MSLDCGNPECGLAFEPRRLDGLYYTDEEYTCARCGAVSVIDVEDDYAFVVRWQCAHGHEADEGDGCGLCAVDAEDL
jgi:hypothetical protein